MNIKNYYIREEDLSDWQIEELGLDDLETYFSVNHEIKEQGKTTEITEYFTEDEMQEILDLGIYYFKARKQQDKELDDHREEMAAADERAASYGFGSIKEMDDFIRELNAEVEKRGQAYEPDYDKIESRIR